MRLFSQEIGLSILIFLLYHTSVANARSDCFAPASPVTLSGTSLAPRYPDGTRLEMHPVACVTGIDKDIIVVFKTGAHTLPVAKIVKGLPGEQFEINEKGHISVSGQVLTNSLGIPYRIPSAKRTMLAAMQRAFDSRIPPDTYLVLGDNPAGQLDSTRLGLIHREDILMVQTP